LSRVGLLGVATASPAHDLPQAEAKAFAASFFADDPARDDLRLQKLLRSYDNAGVEHRQIGQPVSWLGEGRGFAEKNAAYTKHALSLSHAAGAEALERAGVDPSEVGAIIFATSTGIATPSLDGRLIQSLGLPRDALRLPLWGLGCAGGGAALARAIPLARGLGKPVLVIACELCSLTFVHGDRRDANLIAVALFGDGAAACVVAPAPRWRADADSESQGPELLAPYARLLDDTEAIMGWDLEDQGLRVRFSPSIPSLVREVAGGMLDEAAAAAGLSRAQLQHLVLHPGGRRVLDAYAEALDATPEQLRHAQGVLRDHGNMSSPTVLFVLERFLADPGSKRGQAGLLLALGPGFCAEGVSFRW